MRKEIVKLYSWIVRGTQRTTIIKILDKPKTPKQISVETKLKFSNVSDVLHGMKEKRLVVCLNPKEKTGRIYELTKLGKEVRKNI